MHVGWREHSRTELEAKCYYDLPVEVSAPMGVRLLSKKKIPKENQEKCLHESCVNPLMLKQFRLLY